MLNQDEIKQELVAAVASILKKTVNDLMDQDTFKELGMDSLDMFEFILKLEDVFMIEISDEEAEQLDSISNTTNYIKEKLSQ